MSHPHRSVGAAAAAVGCLTLIVPFLLLQLGPEAFAGLSDPGSGVFLFRHLGQVVYFHGILGLLLSSLLVFGGASLYYGRPAGFTILKAAVWVQLLHVVAFESAWFLQVPRQIARQADSRVLHAGATAVVSLGGLAACVLLVLLLRAIARRQSGDAA